MLFVVSGVLSFFRLLLESQFINANVFNIFSENC